MFDVSYLFSKHFNNIKFLTSDSNQRFSYMKQLFDKQTFKCNNLIFVRKN